MGLERLRPFGIKLLGLVSLQTQSILPPPQAFQAKGFATRNPAPAKRGNDSQAAVHLACPALFIATATRPQEIR